MTTDRGLLQTWTQAAEEAARQAGTVLEQWREKFTVRSKGRFDLVTEADVAAQEAVRRCLSGRFPDHAFLGEETAAKGAAPSDPERPTWIVDPLDGTTNYVHGHPVYCVSIGLAYSNELVVGVIFDPSRNELFRAAQGLGAWLNGRPIHTTTTASLEEALISTGFPPDVAGQKVALAAWEHLSLTTQSLRRTGSTALNLAYVAAGRNDGFYTWQAWAWDAAAGVALIREAGGTATKPDGSPYDLAVPEIVATNGPLHPALLKELRGFVGG
jgi:myo-inositol-1(or 4)-monophosphatase